MFCSVLNCNELAVVRIFAAANGRFTGRYADSCDKHRNYVAEEIERFEDAQKKENSEKTG